MKYTPGPWIVETKDDLEHWINAPKGDPDTRLSSWSGLAIVYGFEDGETGQKKGVKNARLIAAAPDMLEALKTIQRITCDLDLLHICEDAIRKATKKPKRQD